ncbi:hypothetical protein HPB48_010843 [Haemaphysalis longicornis]|uniref:Sulfotransferase domain-containing protein n=1 Tax=Haemaphysalis longicornis TaxID=44386 RepID=A0A9J6GK91_HAELO|nr:hypothetical protein HPB48_010843 [Haemaphysalis longicornis]
MDPGICRDIDGVWMHKFFPEENVRSAMKYKPRDGDIIVVTYPKCGTTWTQYIVYNILTRGNPPADVGEYSLMSPFIDMTGANAAENPSRFAAVMTHLPLHAFPPVDHAKYIYVARNPYDCAVSFYHFILGLTPKSVTDVSFGRFLDLFLSGKVIASSCLFVFSCVEISTSETIEHKGEATSFVYITVSEDYQEQL